MLVFTAASMTILLLPIVNALAATQSTSDDREALSNEGGPIGREAAEEAGNFNKTEIERVKRSYGGYLAGRPPQWLQGMWSQDQRDEVDGHFAGFGIRLNNDTFLAHVDSCLATKPSLATHGPEAIDLRMGDTLDINGRRGYWLFVPLPNSRMRYLACGRREQFIDVPTRKFGIFKYARLADKSRQVGRPPDLLSTIYLTENPLVEKPQFESDVMEHTNCNMYSYSSNPLDSEQQSELRKFVMIPIKYMGCKSLECSFRTKSRWDFFCPKLSDAGSPIMCGDGKKISYMVSHVDTGRCDGDIRAYHLAPHYDAISKYIEK